MEIFVTNDDGIDSPGIYTLAQELKKIGNVTVIAPDRQQSAVGHALTIDKPLRVQKFYKNGEVFGYAVNGTPSDCAKLALSTLLEKKPDILVSGINHGQNTAVNILYSGTVSAATEGMLAGIPSIAVSVASHNPKTDCRPAAEYTLKIIKELPSVNLPKECFLNINVPAVSKDKIRGIKITSHSRTAWKDKYEKRTDPFGRDYYWFSGEYNIVGQQTDTDDIALMNNYVSITPIHYDITLKDAIENLKILENSSVNHK